MLILWMNGHADYFLKVEMGMIMTVCWLLFSDSWHPKGAFINYDLGGSAN